MQNVITNIHYVHQIYEMGFLAACWETHIEMERVDSQNVSTGNRRRITLIDAPHFGVDISSAIRQ